MFIVYILAAFGVLRLGEAAVAWIDRRRTRRVYIGDSFIDVRGNTIRPCIDEEHGGIRWTGTHRGKK